MLVELTKQQIEVIVEALGHALNAVPAQSRVAVACVHYAPILQVFERAVLQTPNPETTA